MLTVIRSQQELEEFCTSFLNDNPEFACLDTEFIRQTTYRPQLALIQVASPFRACIIDPVNTNLSFEPFLQILRHPGIVKVLHSGRQDIEIFWSLFGEIPAPIFDTQIASAFLGLGGGIGYDKLVHYFLKIEIDKTSQHTNWLKRPLSQAQLNYALDDVVHLCLIYPLITQQLIEKGRSAWVQESFTMLMNPDTYVVDSNKAWLKIKHQTRKWETLSLLRDLCAWREDKAREYNLTRLVLIEDRLLIDLSQKPFLSFDEVLELIKLYNQKLKVLNLIKEFYFCYILAHQLVQNKEALGQARQAEIKQDIKKIFSKLPPGVVQERMQKVRDSINAIANELGIPTHLIASKSDMESFAINPSPDHKLLSGWRKEILEKPLLKLPKQPATVQTKIID